MPEAAEQNAAFVILNTLGTLLPGNVYDDFLDFYKPSQWLGVHRAVAGFLAKRVADALAAARAAPAELALLAGYFHAVVDGDGVRWVQDDDPALRPVAVPLCHAAPSAGEGLTADTEPV